MPPAIETRLSIRAFTYHADIELLTADISSIGAIDLHSGFTITNETTGRRVRFHLLGVDRDADGDVYGWRFVPAAGQCSPTLRVLIVNT